MTCFRIPILVYEMAAFYMILYKARVFLKGRRFFDTIAANPDHSASSSNLVAVLFRDSILCFGV